MRLARALIFLPALAVGLSARDHAPAGRQRIDLLPLIDPRHDAVRGTWEIQDGALVGTNLLTSARIVVPFIAPEEYVLVIVAARTEGKDALVVGLASGEHQWVHCLDGYTSEGKCLASFEMLDGKLGRDNESARPHRSFAEGAPSVIVYTVRKKRIRVSVNGEEILDWKGDFSRLSVRGDYRVNNSGVLFIGAWLSRFRITKMTLTPLSPGGRRLRD